MTTYMRAIILAVAALILASPGHAKAAPGLDGHWNGALERDGARGEVHLSLRTDAGKTKGTVDLPAMGYFRTDLLGVKEDGDKVTLSIPLPLGALKLIGTREGGVIRGSIDQIGMVQGDWKSLGVRGTFELRQGLAPTVPYRIREVAFRSGGVTLSGSIFEPLGRGPHPGVVFIAGSGDATRGDGSFLADRLARAGVSALVYDKRGTGKSQGDWRSGGFEDLAGDADAALRRLQAEPTVDPRRSGFVCQSQGCWVAPIALRGGAPARFLVAQSGPGVSVADEDLDYYRVTLRAQGFGDAEIAEAFDLATISQKVSQGTADWAALKAAMAKYADRPWFKALGYEATPAGDPIRRFDARTLGYDPKADIDAIHVPTLWVYGGADTIIPVQASMAAIRAARASPRPEVVVIPDAGHSFTVDKGGLPRLADGYPDLVADWIMGPGRTGRRAAK